MTWDFDVQQICLALYAKLLSTFYRAALSEPSTGLCYTTGVDRHTPASSPKAQKQLQVVIKLSELFGRYMLYIEPPLH